MVSVRFSVRPQQARNADQKHKWTLELKGLIVDSLAASVPKKVCLSLMIK